MKVTIKDVAREAKVATSTVSRVLAKSDKISEETKERVNEAIKKLNYTPSIVARGLAKNKTRILAVILPQGAESSFENPFFVQAMKGISMCAQKENYYIMYTFKEENEQWIKKFTEGNIVDGLFLFNAKSDDKTIEHLKKNKFPFVIIGRPEDIKNVLWVDNDNFEAVYQLTQRLIDKGNKKIAFIGAKKELNVSKDRLNGYKQGMFSRGLEVNEELIFEMDDFTEIEGYKAAKCILEKNNVSAFITTDDLLAFGVQNAIKEVGEDISVVGFNNIPLASYRKPSLSSVDINSEKLGFYAAKILIDKLEGKKNMGYHVIETKFIERESS
ncbi:LacI family DNA-binding transcriptional regulator [Clostridium celatum]|uniref:LacI family DNA-binding transcriptional regulator n=1 Tax=Clostridium celatum TaxID=36834 RepID=UPI00189AFC37|nr:LacI family DNA-binding transcriptional regulator [Clostridium celatum]MDU3722050.1 LacI family DNA-binding transcriptional regulator [Clostridium celatum]MDY3359405.1 LacI family DNA-binding transcriptional regulator [Clostridium celatum]